MEYKVKAKKDGKYWTFGQIKEGKYGPQLSFRNTEELKKLVNDGGDWINFALFAEEKKEITAEAADGIRKLEINAAQSDDVPDSRRSASLLDDEIPFDHRYWSQA